MFNCDFSRAARPLAQVSAWLLLPLAAWAQTGAKPGYVLDSQGGFVHSSTASQCWRDGEWTPALAQAACDPVPQQIATAQPPLPEVPPVSEPPQVVVAPKAVATPSTAPPLSMHYAADTLFDFDSFSISANGKKQLDAVGVAILSLQGEKVEVVGHADRIGTAAYNQKLSLQRADAVRDYLKSKGVLGERIATRGAGEIEPLTQAGACATGSLAQVIACLQPDRRVDIEVQGTKIATP